MTNFIQTRPNTFRYRTDRMEVTISSTLGETRIRFQPFTIEEGKRWANITEGATRKYPKYSPEELATILDPYVTAVDLVGMELLNYIPIKP